MLDLGWFSTGRGEGSRGLFRMVMDAIQEGVLDARIQFVFCNRESGEHEGSDQFQDMVRAYHIPLVTLSSQRFAIERGKQFQLVRNEYDQEVIRKLEVYTPNICALAGYMLIVGGEMCRHFDMLNLHPALPNGPKGTWKQVIWSLIKQRASESGIMVHLVTEQVDEGPTIAYCSFPIQEGRFATHWRELDGGSLEEVRMSQGEDYPLFALIRKEQMRRERPLLLETLKAFSEHRLRLERRQVVNAEGRKMLNLCLNEEVERALSLGLG